MTIKFNYLHTRYKKYQDLRKLFTVTRQSFLVAKKQFLSRLSFLSEPSTFESLKKAYQNSVLFYVRYTFLNFTSFQNDKHSPNGDKLDFWHSFISIKNIYYCCYWEWCMNWWPENLWNDFYKNSAWILNMFLLKLYSAPTCVIDQSVFA